MKPYRHHVVVADVWPSTTSAAGIARTYESKECFAELSQCPETRYRSVL
jgi:hypothetical protein